MGLVVVKLQKREGMEGKGTTSAAAGDGWNVSTLLEMKFFAQKGKAKALLRQRQEMDGMFLVSSIICVT